LSAAQALTGSIAANTVQKWLRAWHNEGVPDAVRSGDPSADAAVYALRSRAFVRSRPRWCSTFDSCEGMLVRNPKDTAEWGIFYNGKA